MEKKRKPSQPVFKEYNQDQMWPLPPSLKELIPQNHMVRTVNDAFTRMDLMQILKGYKGGGTSSYHPQMILVQGIKLCPVSYFDNYAINQTVCKHYQSGIHINHLLRIRDSTQ